MEDIRIYEQKHVARYSMRLHHHSSYQILYVIEGTGTLTLKDRIQTFEQDDVAVLFPYDEHEVSSQNHLTLLVIEFDEKWFQDQVTSEWKASFFKHSALLKLNKLHSGEMRQLLRKLLFEQQQEQTLNRWAMKVYWLQLLLVLAQARETSPILDANDLRAERIRHFVDTHYYMHISSEVIAQQLGITSRHANAIFKEKYKTTPFQYLAEVRINVAKKLLVETDKDIISISFEVGYESLPTFYRVFKNLVMISPSQFRQQYFRIQE